MTRQFSIYTLVALLVGAATSITAIAQSVVVEQETNDLSQVRHAYETVDGLKIFLSGSG